MFTSTSAKHEGYDDDCARSTRQPKSEARPLMGEDRRCRGGRERQNAEYNATMSNGHCHHCKRCEQWKTDDRAQRGGEHFEPKRSRRHTPPQDEKDNEPR